MVFQHDKTWKDGQECGISFLKACDDQGTGPFQFEAVRTFLHLGCVPDMALLF